MPVVTDGVYRLSDGEVRAVWGLSERLRVDLLVGFEGAVASAQVRSVGEASEAFFAHARGHGGAWKMLLGFSTARPLVPADAGVLGRALRVPAGELACAAEPVALYGVSHRLECQRREAGVHRRDLAGLTGDPEGVLGLLGMAGAQRPTRQTLKRMAFAAFLSDTESVVAGWVAAFSEGVKS